MEYGSQLRLPLRCLPSMRTTARTGPSCSTFVSSMTDSNRSYFCVPWSPSSISPWRRRTSRPSLAISVEPRVTDLTRLDPLLPSLATTTPVSTVTTPPLVETLTFLSGAAALLPSARASVSAPGPTACAVHFSEPSGHWASGQVWTGTCLPSSVVRANSCPFSYALGPGHADGGAGGRAEPAVLQPAERDRVGLCGCGGRRGLRLLAAECPAELRGGAGDRGGLEEGPAGNGGHRRSFPCMPNVLYEKGVDGVLRMTDSRYTYDGNAFYV